MCAHVVVLLTSGVGRKKYWGGGGGGGRGSRERKFKIRVLCSYLDCYTDIREHDLI